MMSYLFKKKTLLVAMTSAALMLGGCDDDEKTVIEETAPVKDADEFLVELAHPEDGIGQRIAGEESEKEAADYLMSELQEMDYKPELQEFTYDGDQESSNVLLKVKGQSSKTIVLGAHYDTTGEGPDNTSGSLGAADNGSGVAVLLEVASRLRGYDLPYTVIFAFFGAEENGLNGSEYYVNNLPQDTLDDIVGMVNYDTVAGGDYLYIHSAITDGAYNCTDVDGGNTDYTGDSVIRQAMLEASEALPGDVQFEVHPGVTGAFLPGETGEWSDHVPFACKGIPIGYVEATNFDINGEFGYDGYSQTVDEDFWSCYDAPAMTACDRDTESEWGEIWHTDKDRLDVLDVQFPNRMSGQMSLSARATVEFVINADFYLP